MQYVRNRTHQPTAAVRGDAAAKITRYKQSKHADRQMKPSRERGSEHPTSPTHVLPKQSKTATTTFAETHLLIDFRYPLIDPPSCFRQRRGRPCFFLLAKNSLHGLLPRSLSSSLLVLVELLRWGPADICFWPSIPKNLRFQLCGRSTSTKRESN